MDLTGAVEAFLSFLSEYSFTKTELFGLIAGLSLVVLIPFFLAHRRKMVKMKYDFRLKSDKLNAKIEAEKMKRERKAVKGKKQ